MVLQTGREGLAVSMKPSSSCSHSAESHSWLDELTCLSGWRSSWRRRQLRTKLLLLLLLSCRVQRWNRSLYRNTEETGRRVRIAQPQLLLLLNCVVLSLETPRLGDDDDDVTLEDQSRGGTLFETSRNPCSLTLTPPPQSPPCFYSSLLGPQLTSVVKSVVVSPNSETEH